MIGPIAIIVALLLIPVGVLIGGGFLAVLLGSSLQADGQARAEGSELAELGD